MSTFDDMVSFLDSAWCAKDTIVPCLIGSAGIGKTAAVMQHAKNVEAGKVITIIASQILPNEVSGITMPDSTSKSMEIYDHYRLSSLKDGDILFFDELLEADQLVLSACLTLIESRQMMSGKKLPNIQIVAATNPTIVPSMLRENIRQRFLFKSFSIDRAGCRKYIKRIYGFDIDELANQIEEKSTNYNTLTPRTMTKLAAWISEAGKDNAICVADTINACFNSTLGSALYEKCYLGTPEQQAMKSARDVAKGIIDDEKWETLGNRLADAKTLSEMIQILIEQPEWQQISEALDNFPAPEELDFRF